jgi:hypothetical protein
MANTVVRFLRAYDSSLTAKLVSIGGTGTPNASGYSCTNTNGMQSITVPEALVGDFYLYAYDSLDEIAYQGYLKDLLDTVGPFYAAEDVASATAMSQTSPTAIRTSVGLESANLASLVQAVIGKKNVTDNGNGTYDIAIRNTTDTTTLITIRHNPVTGATTVV